ncbi:MAG: hypothetical protein CNLJKLNK_01389 [Holosporales bacterium]
MIRYIASVITAISCVFGNSLPYGAENTKNVLSVDGGGARIIVAATALDYLGKKIGVDDISKRFDFFAGVSAGAQLVLYLTDPDCKKTADALGFCSAQTVSKFLTQSTWNKIKTLNGYFGPAYNVDDLQSVLESAYNRHLLKDRKDSKPVMAIAFDATNAQKTTFKSWDPSFAFVKASLIASASSCVPTYFMPTIIKNVQYVDGMVATINPSIDAYIEARELFKESKSKINMISIGTGMFAGPSEPNVIKNGGAIEWAMKYSTLQASSTIMASDDMTRTLMGASNDQFVRIEVPLDKSISFDTTDPSDYEYLKQATIRYMDNNPEMVQKAVRMLAKG